MWVDLGQSHASLGVCTSLRQLSLRVSVMILTSAPCSFISSTFSSTELPELGPVLDCESLNLLLSGTGWRFHDDNWGSHQSRYRGRPVQPYSPLLPGVMWVLWINSVLMISMLPLVQPPKFIYLYSNPFSIICLPIATLGNRKSKHWGYFICNEWNRSQIFWQLSTLEHPVLWNYTSIHYGRGELCLTTYSQALCNEPSNFN